MAFPTLTHLLPLPANWLTIYVHHIIYHAIAQQEKIPVYADVTKSCALKNDESVIMLP